MPLIEREYMGSPEPPKRSVSSDSSFGIFYSRVILTAIGIAFAIFVVPKIFSPHSHSPSDGTSRNQSFRVPAKPKLKPKDRLAKISPIDINTASHSDLILLPRVNTKLANGIISGRPYYEVDQLDDVYGIGPKTVAKLRPHVVVNLRSLQRNFPDQQIDVNIIKRNHN